VQCEGSVRDPIRLAALAWTNQVGRPSGLGINTGALLRPPERRISQTVAEKEKNGGGSLVSSRSVRGTAVTAKAVRPFLFLYIRESRGANSEAAVPLPSSRFATR